MKLKTKQLQFKKIKKKDYLENVKIRLENDVAPYMKLIKKIQNTTGVGIGFWALVRMIFPIIDELSNTLYRKSRKNKYKHIKLLQKLGLKFPNLIWEMYRNGLIHHDIPRKILYKDIEIKWGIKTSGKHEYKKDMILININQVYDSLVYFIKSEINKAKNKSIYMHIGVKYNKKLGKELKNEIIILQKQK